MDEGRLLRVSQVVARKRRLAAINDSHDQERLRLERERLTREAAAKKHKTIKDSLSYKHRLVDINLYTKCMSQHKRTVEENTSPGEQLYGRYGGVTKEELKPAMDEIVQRSRASVRRLKQARKLLEGGKKNGQLVDYDQAMEKMKEITERPFKEFELTKRNSLKLPAIQINRKQFALVRENRELDSLRYILQKRFAVVGQ